MGFYGIRLKRTPIVKAVHLPICIKTMSFVVGVVKSTKVKKYTDINAVNELDLEKALRELEENDPNLVELNLNNHKDVTPEVLSTVAKKLKTNRHVKRLFLANCRMRDPSAKVFDFI